jgi:hypothetical protein
MNEDQQSEKAWLDWIEVQREAATLIRRGDHDAALSNVEAFLSRETNPELRSDALGFRADLKGRLGNIAGAKDDLITARTEVGPSYGRYVHELSLGTLCESQNLPDEAISWYREALKTCLQGDHISAGTVIDRLINLRPPAALSPEDIDLCQQAIRRSWQVLRLPGIPDLSDLPSSVSEINAAQARPLKALDGDPNSS